MKQVLHRFLNGIRKIASGLRPFSESVWPGVRNDLFVAHESIYKFFAAYARDADVLDAGCGTGYGTSILAEAAAKSVLGVDIDRRNIRFARKHYRRANLTFEIENIEKLNFLDGSFDLVVASNSVEHLHHPDVFVQRLRSLLRPDGIAIIAVPPIYTTADVDVHQRIRYHRSNLAVSEWAALMANAGFKVSSFLHHVRDGLSVDFDSHLPTGLTSDDFVFTPTTLEGLLQQPSITALFLLANRATIV
jgi:2-polyprenyl-3-methyl-5-hydroxy-6-metoxy-1,4-benzoquinol methylase